MYNGLLGMPDRIECTFFRDSHDRFGVGVSVTWDALAARCARHEEGTKDGPALACATFDYVRAGTRPDGKRYGRGNASLVARTMVALDIEEHRVTGEVPIPVEAMADYLAARGIRSAIWTTHSHTPDLPRYRVLLPLEAPLTYSPETDPYLSGAVAAELRVAGVSDASKYGAASLFFLPRHAPGNPHFSRIIPGSLMSNGRLETAALMAAQQIAADEAEEAALRRANTLPPEVSAKIEAYNEAHALPAQLERYGYRRDGMRWRSTNQHGQGATVILPDGRRWATFSESDAQAGVGARPLRASSQTASWGDSFALYVAYEHRGNFRAALAALGE